MSQKVTKQEFEAAGGDPLKIQCIKEAVGNIPKTIEAEEREKFENGETGADSLEMMPEGEPLFPSIAGVQVIRDITPGVFNILNKMKSPLITGEDIEDNDYLNECAFLLYLISFEDVAQLVRWFHEGHEKLREEFDIWSFENIDLQQAFQEFGKIEDMITAIGNAADEIPVDDGKSSKKKYAG